MKKIFVLLFGIILFTACNKDFLDRSSLTELAEDNFWQNSSDARLGVNGIYDVLHDRVLYSGNLNGSAGLPNYDGFTDNVYNGYKYEGPGFFVEGNISVAVQNFFSGFWASNYRGIVRSNTAIFNIEKMDASKISDATRSNLLAQAHFLRALFYFNVAVYFVDAPLITKPQTLEEAFVPKNKQQEILDQVIADLEYASTNLPVSVPAELTGYATKAAAFGLMARVQLFNKKFPEAAVAAQGAIDLNRHDLSTPYTTIFTEAGENTKEIVFSVRFQEAAGFNTSENFAATFYGQPKVNCQPLPNLINEYYSTTGQPVNIPHSATTAAKKLNRDPRLTASIWFYGDVFAIRPNGQNAIFTANSPAGLTGYGQRKYVHTGTSPLGTNAAGAQSQDFYILRYADILLMRAEALIESDPSNPEIYSLINQVRARVSMPTIQAAEGPNRTKAQLTEILRHERRVELAFEGLRFIDLKRWGIVQEAYTRIIADRNATPKLGPYNPNYNGLRSETFPIPTNELDRNKNLIQNDAWK
jgi:hypothetical protein